MIACLTLLEPPCSRWFLRSTFTATISCVLAFLAIITRPNSPSPRIPQKAKSLMPGCPESSGIFRLNPCFSGRADPRPRTPKVKLFVLGRGKSRCAIPTVRCEITEQISAHQSMHLPDDAFFGDERIGKSMTYHVDLQQR